ncbi:ATP-grasp domain-containing protein [Planctobacterium marinum]|uniref:Carboxylate--amine ligase n=1 Tax=Planctobacterium marinum TaxID=1631968 RepID=A0AA48HND1_9ALTE|nr:carboxylate--amine ligase [Planctobacterium marinum]
MNFIFLSPQFPPNYYLFCEGLKKRGVNVIGLSDAPFESLSPQLVANLSDYYQVTSLEKYDEVYRAVAALIHKHGRIHQINAHNEHWLELEAHLRTDFNIPGINQSILPDVKNKSDMKRRFRQAGCNVVEGAVVDHPEQAHAFVEKFGYPLVAKPDKGVGASGTYRLTNHGDLEEFLRVKGDGTFFFEEFIEGDIYTFDGMVDYDGNPLFLMSCTYSSGVMDIVNKDLDLFYYYDREIPEDLITEGKKLLKEYDLRMQFFHFEFFRRYKDNKLICLEVNMRPPGGRSMDMFNFAMDANLYDEWANALCHNQPTQHLSINHYCAYVGRKLHFNYKMHHDEILKQYGHLIRYKGEVPQVFSRAMGHYCYIFCCHDKEEMLSICHAMLDKH